MHADFVTQSADFHISQVVQKEENLMQKKSGLMKTLCTKLIFSNDKFVFVIHLSNGVMWVC